MSLHACRLCAVAFFTLALLGGPLGCDGGSDAARISAGVPTEHISIPTTEPYVRGTITAAQPGDSVRPAPSTTSPDGPVSCPPTCNGGVTLRFVLVEEVPGEQRGIKVRGTILAGAKLYQRQDGNMRRIDFSDLRVGQRVEVWMEGPIAESYPEQGTIGTLVVLP